MFNISVFSCCITSPINLLRRNGLVYTFQGTNMRSSKIMRWVPDTSHAHCMEKLTHFDDLLNYCLDNRDTMGKRDILASLSYMNMTKYYNLSNSKFIQYNDFICSNLDKFNKSIHLLIHRYAILGYTKGLISIFDNYIKYNLNNLDNKSLTLIAWGYAKNNIYLPDLFDYIATYIFSDDKVLKLTDLSLLMWSFSKVERRVPYEITRLKDDLFKILSSVEDSLKSDGEIIGLAKDYLDDNRTFYTNVLHDVSMCAKALSVLLPRDTFSILKLLQLLFSITSLGNLSFTAQAITSIWECMHYGNIKDEYILEKLLEASRYLRLDHSFNSNMLNSIVIAIYKLNIRDPRIIYQIVHWIEKKSIQMRSHQMYSIIHLLDEMGIYNEKVWKQLGVVVQKKAIDLELNEIKHLYSIFKRNGKGNDRIFGILEHFISCKHDIKLYGPT